MFPFAPMPLLDDFLLNYNIGQAILLLFVLSIPAALTQGSVKLVAVNAILFGGLFAIVPSIGGGPAYYMFLGIALLVVGPLLFVMARR